MTIAEVFVSFLNTTEAVSGLFHAGTKVCSLCKISVATQGRAFNGKC